MKAICLILLLLNLQIWASELVDENIEEVSKPNKMRMYAIGDYMMIPSPGEGEDLTGFGISFMGQVAFSEKIALNFSARQTFSLGGSAIVTGMDGRLTYAITGKLLTEDSKIEVGDKDVVISKDTDVSGFRVQVLASQFFFNASSNTVPYNGFGVTGYYEMSFQNSLSIIGGARYDLIYNNEFTTTPISGFAGIGISF